MSSSQYIISLYNSIKTLIALLRTQGYDVSDYESFSINEVDAMHANSQMDLLLTDEKKTKKVYVKYVNHVRQNNLDVFIEDLFYAENVLNKETDALIIVSDDEPNECMLNKLQYLYDHDGIFVTIYNIRRLQFNILEHMLTPKTRILSKEEEEAFKQKYNISSYRQVPEISRFDPLAMAIGMRPHQICEIIRNSSTALESIYYRVCV